MSKKTYAVIGEVSGYMDEFDTLKEARKYLSMIKRTDKKEGYEDIYVIHEWVS